MRDKKIKIVDSGLIDYAQALELQLQLLKDRQSDKIANTVLLLEHPAVITLGARKSENKLITTEEYLLSQKIMLESAGRGGGTTAHNPGQIVMYPIIKLKSLGLGVNESVRSLEAIGIELLKRLGLRAGNAGGACHQGTPQGKGQESVDPRGVAGGIRSRRYRGGAIGVGTRRTP